MTFYTNVNALNGVLGDEEVQKHVFGGKIIRKIGQWFFSFLVKGQITLFWHIKNENTANHKNMKYSMHSFANIM